MSSNQLGGFRVFFVAGLAVVVIAFMLATGRRDLFLLLGRETTTGRVTRVDEDPPGRIRASDFRVTYAFVDRAGHAHTGEDVLPRAYPPAADGSISIVYSTRDPAISRIESQVSLTPIGGILMGLILLGGIVVPAVLARVRQAIAKR